MTLALLVYIALSVYCIVWRWRSPGSVGVKLWWTIVCLVVPAGGAFMLELSRPWPPAKPHPIVRSFQEAPPPPPGSGLAALSALSIGAALSLGTAWLAGLLGAEVNVDVSHSGLAALALLAMGVYGVARARVVLERHAAR